MGQWTSCDKSAHVLRSVCEQEKSGMECDFSSHLTLPHLDAHYTENAVLASDFTRNADLAANFTSKETLRTEYLDTSALEETHVRRDRVLDEYVPNEDVQPCDYTGLVRLKDIAALGDEMQACNRRSVDREVDAERQKGNACAYSGGLAAAEQLRKLGDDPGNKCPATALCCLTASGAVDQDDCPVGVQRGHVQDGLRITYDQPGLCEHGVEPCGEPACGSGYRLNEGKRRCVPCDGKPEGATFTNSCEWVCKTPENASTVSADSCEWACDDGHLRADENGKPDPSGSLCVPEAKCGLGAFRGPENRCEACPALPNPHARFKTWNTCEWECRDGYVRSDAQGKVDPAGATCQEVIQSCSLGSVLNREENRCVPCTNKPATASFVRMDSCDWACHGGYVRANDQGKADPAGSTCEEIKTAESCPLGTVFDEASNYCDACPELPAHAVHTTKNSCDWKCTTGMKRVGDRCECGNVIANAYYTDPSKHCGIRCNHGYKMGIAIGQNLEGMCVRTDVPGEIFFTGNRCNTYPADKSFPGDLGKRFAQCKAWIDENTEAGHLCAHNGVLMSPSAYKAMFQADCPEFDAMKKAGKVTLKPLEYSQASFRQIKFWVDAHNCYPCVSGLHEGLPQTYDKFRLAENHTDAALVTRTF